MHDARDLLLEILMNKGYSNMIDRENFQQWTRRTSYTQIQNIGK